MGGVVEMPIPDEAVARAMAEKLGRELDEEEWRMFFDSEPPSSVSPGGDV